MTVSQAMQQGFTRSVLADGGPYSLELMVKPDADLDSRFPAYDVETGEFIAVSGWLFSVEALEA